MVVAVVVVDGGGGDCGGNRLIPSTRKGRVLSVKADFIVKY